MCGTAPTRVPCHRHQAVLLSAQSSTPETIFATIFAIVWLGAVILTLNVLLLVSAPLTSLASLHLMCIRFHLTGR